MLVALAAVLMLAIAPSPSPEPTNPFTLTNTPAPLPVIGRTHSRLLCTALRRSVLPAIDVAAKNDVQFTGARTSFFKYYTQNEGLGKDFMLFKLDQTTLVAMQKNLDAYDSLMADPALVPLAYRNPDDLRTVEELKKRAHVLRAAQDLEIMLLSGLLETERMNRYRQPSELEHGMKVALGTDQLGQAQGDQKVIQQYYDQFHGVAGLGALGTAKAVDTDLGTLQTIHLSAAKTLQQIVEDARKNCAI
jgi:hypothetical protein